MATRRLSRAERSYQHALKIAKRRNPKEYGRVIELLTEAISGGHAIAMHALATWYLFGVGVRRDPRKGLALERRAARLGVAEAAYNAAVSYETGRGVARSYAKALRFYRRAARLGDKDALFEVGRMYYYGFGVSKNRTTAERWFRRAEIAGVREAQPRRRKPSWA